MGGLRLHALSVFFKLGEYLWAVVDLHNPGDNRSFPRPTRCEYDLNNVLSGIVIQKLANSVFDGLVLFKQPGFFENLTAVQARVDFIAYGEVIGFGERTRASCGLDVGWDDGK